MKKLICGIRVLTVGVIVSTLFLTGGRLMAGDCVPSPGGLVGWWPGDGNASDLLGANNGIVVGGVSYTNGMVGQAFNLKGNGAYVSVANSPALNITNQITVECWFLSRKWSPGGFGLFSKRDPSGKANYAVNISTVYGLDLYYNDFSVNDGDFGSDFEISAYYPVSSLNVFHHFAGTFNQIDATHVKMETYLDGVLVTNKTKLGNLANTLNTAPLTVGSSVGLTEFFDGVIDEFSLYNRALSADEIHGIFAAGSAGKCRTPVYDLSVDFDRANNPSGVWSFGWQSTLGGTFTLDTIGKSVPSQENLPMETWSSGPYTAQVQHNGNTQTITTDGAAGVFPPGTIIFNPGLEGQSDNFSTIRFTAPPQGGGDYRVEVAVHTYLDGPISGDSDFHIVKGATELFGQAIPGNGGTSYSNLVKLAAGQSIDFVCGRGPDGRLFASGLKFASKITFLKGSVPPPTECVTPPSGLVGWWPGDGNVNDLLGANNGVAVGGVSYTNGMVGQAFNLNGTGAQIVISDSPALNLVNEITVECWFLSRKWSPGGFGLFSKRDPSGKANYAVNISTVYGLDLYYNDFSVNDGDFGSDYEISAYFPVPSLNVFHHFAGTFKQVDATHVRMETYLDGVLVTNKTKLGNLANTLDTAPLTIGSSVGVTEFFDGVIDEFSLYNRVLSADEIHAIFDAGSAGKCHVPVAPTIVFQPKGQTVTAGEDVTFSAAAAGTAPLGFQWRLNGNDIPGQNSSSLVLHVSQQSDAGRYSVIVSNVAGKATSDEAELKVLPLVPTYDLANDFSATMNPAGSWSFGWETIIGGLFTVFDVAKAVPDINGVFLDTWSRGPETAQVQHNGTTKTVITDAGRGVFPPGSVIFNPGHRGNPDNYSVIRWTVPSDGTYEMPVSVQTYLQGPGTGDTEFHLLKDNVELFGEFIAPNGGTSYSNNLTLSGGEKIDFLCGRGLDDLEFASGLVFASHIVLVDTAPKAPRILLDPVNHVVRQGANVQLVVVADGTGPLSYQWRLDGSPLDGRTNAILLLTNVKNKDEGSYSVIVSSPHGSAESASATLSVKQPPVAHASVSPLFDLRPLNTNLLVISADGIGATVVLDALGSTDPENSAFTCAWYDAALTQFAIGVKTTNIFAIGTHTITLAVGDGQSVGTETVTFDVITCSEAVASLVELFEDPALSSSVSRVPISQTKAALMSFLKGNIKAGVSQLRALEKTIARQIAPQDPAAAQVLGSAIEQIIGSLAH